MRSKKEKNTSLEQVFANEQRNRIRRVNILLDSEFYKEIKHILRIAKQNTNYTKKNKK